MKRPLLTALCIFAGCTQTPTTPALPRVLEFTSQADCKGCLEMEPIVKEVGGIRQIDVNTEEGMRLAEEWRITRCPTFIHLDRNGYEDERLVGKHSVGRLRKFADGVPDVTAAARAKAKKPELIASATPTSHKCTNPDCACADCKCVGECKCAKAVKTEAKIVRDTKAEDQLRSELSETKSRLTSAYEDLDARDETIRRYRQYRDRMETFARQHGFEVDGDEQRGWRPRMPQDREWSRVR